MPNMNGMGPLGGGPGSGRRNGMCGGAGRNVAAGMRIDCLGFGGMRMRRRQGNAPILVSKAALEQEEN
jgi:hypothetical protein